MISFDGAETVLEDFQYNVSIGMTTINHPIHGSGPARISIEQ
jgi:hypothetical protein